ncbi:MAG: sulfite exporter TauE/SafE family protein [Cytophagales bacterium]|nr:sulfite exporter TauE/SafE family protein [Cytophaga sp.]
MLVHKINEFNARSPVIKILAITTLFTVAIAFYISYNIYIAKPDIVRIAIEFISTIFNPALTKYILVGIAAQLVDGALGMAYGVTWSSFLLGLGVPPALTSASVHVAEIFTTGASGLSHLRFGNVNKKLFKYLLIPGMLGAILGAWILSDLINGNIIKPFIAIYLMILGVIILRKAFKKLIPKQKTKHVGWLAGFGGFMDAIGGGGWGPIVTSTLLSKGRSANYTIGSVNLAEFFIALAGAGTFLIFTGLSGWQAIAGLVIGGVIAAPFAAFVVSRIKRKTLMIIVGTLVIVLSMRTFITSDYQQVFHTIKGIF